MHRQRTLQSETVRPASDLFGDWKQSTRLSLMSAWALSNFRLRYFKYFSVYFQSWAGNSRVIPLYSYQRDGVTSQLVKLTPAYKQILLNMHSLNIINISLTEISRRFMLHLSIKIKQQMLFVEVFVVTSMWVLGSFEIIYEFYFLKFK